jgi:riboflavin biosynthesis pyrimidine reductase
LWQDRGVRLLFPADLAEVSQSNEVDLDDLVELYAFPTDRLWVRSMFISSLDGAITAGSGRSGSLSTPGDHQVFALQRSLCDVILVGAGTARTEHYLPVRASEVSVELRQHLGLAPTPPIALVTRTPDWESPLLHGGSAPTILVVPEDTPVPRADVSSTLIRAGVKSVDLGRALDQLADRGYRRVICEGGPGLLAQVVAAGRVDDVCLTVAPSLVAGPGKRMLEGPGFEPPIDLSLAHLLEEDGALFARYLVRPGPSVG